MTEKQLKKHGSIEFYTTGDPVC